MFNWKLSSEFVIFENCTMQKKLQPYCNAQYCIQWSHKSQFIVTTFVNSVWHRKWVVWHTNRWSDTSVLKFYEHTALENLKSLPLPSLCHDVHHTAWQQSLYAYIHKCMQTCIHIYIHTSIHIYIHTYIHTCIHIYTHTQAYVYTYMHTYIYTYMHT